MKVGASHSTLFLAAHLGFHFVCEAADSVDRDSLNTSENLHSSIIIGAVQLRKEKALGRLEWLFSI